MASFKRVWRVCHCPTCREAFREWLKKKYGTLDALNKQWWTYFWAHTYTDWSQIEPPSPKGETSNHGLTLDWKRFVTAMTADFMNEEIKAVRKYTPEVPVTTNLMGFYPGLDYRELCKSLDFVSWDSYPDWRGNERDVAVAARTSLEHDLMRSLLHKPFLLMESTPSMVNWRSVSKMKRPGMNELGGLQAIAHGSDSVQYFQWRKSRGGSEKFHGAVVDHVGNEHTRVFGEVAHLGERLKKLDSVCGTLTDSKVAIMYDWSCRWALEDAQSFCKGDKKVVETLEKHYYPLWKRGIDTDIVGFEDDLGKYRLVIAPMLYTVSAELEEKLVGYVKNGGTLVCTYMTGMVNENDLCHLGGLPAGRLKDVFGIWCEEIDSLYPEDRNEVAFGEKKYEALDYCELVHTRGAETLARYDKDFYSGMPAFTVNSYGKGKAYYVAFRDRGDFTDDVTGMILGDLGIHSEIGSPLPYGVTAHSRTDGTDIFVFIQNFTYSEQTVVIPECWKTVEEGQEVKGSFTLAPLQTLIITKKR